MFVNFIFANTVFSHTHQEVTGRLVTHSHPYNPAGHHSHSSHSLDQIAAVNAAAAAFEGAQTPVLDVVRCVTMTLCVEGCAEMATTRPAAVTLRGPPYAG